MHGGAGIIDIENPETALGNVRPLDILKIRRTALNCQVSCNIGEEQILYTKAGDGEFHLKSKKEMAAKAAQAALGVASCGVNIIKVGLDNMESDVVELVLSEIVQSLNRVFPIVQVCPVFFANEYKNYESKVNPFIEGVEIATKCKADAIMVDTREITKKNKITLVPYNGPIDFNGHICTLDEIQRFVDFCHKEGLECMLAGSVQLSQVAALWATGCDGIAVRGSVGGRGYPKEKVNRELVSQMVPK
jgi:uncharacterized protein (UPF0264 family)